MVYVVLTVHGLCMIVHETMGMHSAAHSGK